KAGYTLQIGNGPQIFNATKVKTICDFRVQDVQLGGQGAPLVPIGDKLLFSKYNYCLNLGGFANVSFEEKNKRIAFDICPVNIVMNFYAKQLGKEYDNKGLIARKGKIHKTLLNDLNAISFYKKTPPKSLGFEFVKAVIFPLIQKYNLPVPTILRTFIEHIAIQMASVIKGEKKECLITGGGAFNTFLIEVLAQKTAVKLILPSEEIINYKEALIFALLGYLKNFNQVNCLQSVTGASRNHSSGVIYS
ncbi:MAG TPA: anhydro-N-acetylmuramic acid kinase, partial [Flavobacteriaceae bacterium]|nr:anhydro-N-acetylmuramic acid kinase [Flavobacteriaceae bacterium]